MVLASALASGSILFLYCYYGKLATDCYGDMSDCYYKCNWYNLPVKLQTYFIMMIMNAQRPLDYDGFSVAFLNLQTYTNVSIISIYSLSDILLKYIFLI